MTRNFTCIICPNGCDIAAELEGGKLVSMEGALCKRGAEYVTQELVNPMRTISTSILVENGVLPLASVRLTNPVPREQIFFVMEEVRKVRLTAPVAIGQVVIHDVLGLDSDVVITKNVPTSPIQSTTVAACLQGVTI